MTYPSFSAGEVLRATDMNAVGLWLVASGSLSTATTDFVGCFTSAYDNYRIVITSPQVSSAADIYFRLLDGTTPKTTNYYYGSIGFNTAGTALNTFGAGGAEVYTGWTCSAGGAGTDIGMLAADITTPFVAKKTSFAGSYMAFQTAYKVGTFSATQTDATSYSGLRISTLTAATLTGTATIYGYKKA